MNKTQAISIKNLSVVRDSIRALDSVSCDFLPGEIVALIGPNGSGKSTLIDCLSGFLQAESGTMQIGETKIDLRGVFSPNRHSICRTFQTPRIAKYMNVTDQLLLATKRTPDNTSAPAQKVSQILNLLDIGDCADRMGETLSYGQQKLVETARLLLAEPRLVFFDEPLSGLSPQKRDVVLRAMRKLAEAGAAVVIVEHDFPSVNAIAHRAYVLEEGAVFMSGAMQDIVHNPSFHDLYLGV